MARGRRRPFGLEGEDFRCTHHDALIVIIPSIRSKNDVVISALELCEELLTPFINDIMEVVTELSGSDGLSYVNFLDIAQFNIDPSRSEEERALLYALIHQMGLPYYRPLVCFIPLGQTDEDKYSTIHIAWKAKEETDVDVAILNIDRPEDIHEATKEGVRYIIGTGGTKYQIRNVIVNGHSGPLLSTPQVLKSIAQGGKKIGKDQQEADKEEEVRKKD